MTMEHVEVTQLIVGYSFAAVLAFTAIATAASLVGWIKFANESQQKKLFNLLIVELIVIGVGFFSDYMKFDANNVANAIIDKGKSISVNAPENYATYIDRRAEVGFAYPEQYILDTPGSDIHHGKLQLEGDAKGWLGILTFVPTDSERLLREEQGKSDAYYLDTHIASLKAKFPFIDSTAEFVKEEIYPTSAGVGKLVVFDSDRTGIPSEIHMVLIYTPSHMIHTFTLQAFKNHIDKASVQLRNIVATVTVPKGV